MDSVRSGPFGQIFRPDNFIFGQASIRTTAKMYRACAFRRDAARALQVFLKAHLCCVDGRGQQLGQGSLHRGRRADRLRPGHCAEGGRVV